ncbi:glycosyl transferase family 2 [Halothece sp. PCC 7418]|uniref:TIGR04283 family arsenosugar biosynthesis glycosyltransferase n=1 Tax=Halothece sp. (strain PCC 7418) TaxID=65093 RepID=UPI0002A08927|nr:TIGR04283 family arsenosugar biosynthesis glycosyltransferase [Halothece sp. PCC 7418]AFZ43403.1 glycosyl transferase family 2 [Halothece sp. PCC 7418]
MTRVSIIIPTLNEATLLQKTLPRLSLLSPTAKEIIIVDGGSEDRTLVVIDEIVSQFFPPSVIQVIKTSRGRAKQLNAGVEIATGDYLCFLHADTYVPYDLVDVISKVLFDPNIACAGFISIMSGCQKTRWGISLHNFLKTYYAPFLFRPWLFFRKGLRVLFGDQVMFCRRKEFLDCGGFDATLPIMEEADLCFRLCHYGRIKQVNRIVESSDRRVAKWGTLKANFIYLMIGSLWGMGVSAHWLKRFYEEVR